MFLLPLSVELLLDIFASWTLGYHFVLWSRWPAYLTVPVWIVLAAPLVVLTLKGKGILSSRGLHSAGNNRLVTAEALPGSSPDIARAPFLKSSSTGSTILRSEIALPAPRFRMATLAAGAIRHLGISPGPALCLSMLGLAAALFTVTVLRPDYDDLTLFHRILVQDWRQPFLTGDTVTNYPGLPPQSILHVTTAYEPLVGLIAKITHLDPLHLYHNGPSILAALVMVAIYFLLYRTLGLGEWTAVAAIGCVLVFLTIDGNAHGSFGNVALDRLWQGKCIVWSVLVPGCLLAADRFLSEPSYARLLRLGLLGISAVGLSEVGVYTLPLLAGAIGVAWLVISRDRTRQLKPVLLLWASMSYPVAFGAALALGILHKPGPHDVWSAYPAVWYKNLALVIGTQKFGLGVARDLAALILMPLVVLKGRSRVFLVSLSLVLIVLTTNPVAAPFWMRLLYQASYWRLAFLFPLPLCAGLVAAAFSKLRSSQVRTRLANGLAAILFLGTTAAAFQHTTRLPIRPDFKRPWSLQLEGPAYGFSLASSPLVHGDHILAPEAIVCTLAMLRPELRFESSRPVNDPIKFGEVGLESEGRKRVDAQLFTECDIRPQTWKAFQAVLNDGVDTVILRQCPERDLNELCARLPGWRVTLQNDSFVLLLKQQEPQR